MPISANNPHDQLAVQLQPALIDKLNSNDMTVYGEIVYQPFIGPIYLYFQQILKQLSQFDGRNQNFIDFLNDLGNDYRSIEQQIQTNYQAIEAALYQNQINDYRNLIKTILGQQSYNILRLIRYQTSPNKLKLVAKQIAYQLNQFQINHYQKNVLVTESVYDLLQQLSFDYLESTFIQKLTNQSQKGSQIHA